MGDTQTLMATLYSARTYNLDDAALAARGIVAVATVTFELASDFEQPVAIAWDGKVWLKEDGAGFGAGYNRYHRLDPVSVQATPV